VKRSKISASTSRFGSKITVLILAGSARRQIPKQTARLAILGLCTGVVGMETKQWAGMARAVCLARTCM